MRRPGRACGFSSAAAFSRSAALCLTVCEQLARTCLTDQQHSKAQEDEQKAAAVDQEGRHVRRQAEGLREVQVSSSYPVDTRRMLAWRLLLLRLLTPPEIHRS